MVHLWPARTAGWALLFCAVSALGRLVLVPDSGVAMFWQAAGVAVLWMAWSVRHGRLVADACLLLACTIAVNHLFGVGHLASVLFGVSNLVQGVVVALWWGRTRRLGPAMGLGDLVLLLVASVVAALLSAVPASLAASLGSTDVGWRTVAHLVVRNTTGSVVVVAVVHTLVHAFRARTGVPSTVLDATATRRRGLELGTATAASVALNAWVFGSADQLPLAFLPLATAAWIGSRFAPWVAALHGVLSGVCAVSLTSLGRGPFGGIGSVEERVLVVQVFVVLAVVLTLMLAIGNAERQVLLDRARGSEASERERATLLDTVLQVMRDGLVLVDDGGRITLRNRAASELIGDDAEGARGGHLLRQRDGSALDLAELVALLPERGTVDDQDVESRGPDGEQTRVISLSAVPLPLPDDEADRRRHAVVSLRDVTAERRRVRELEDYAGVVAHDLKNPIAAVMSWAGLIDHDLRRMPESDLVVRARSSLGNLQVATRQAHELVDELLQYARAQTGALEAVRVSLDEVVAGIVQVITSLPTRDPRPVIEATPMPDVLADPTLVRQVLVNVIGNAVRYVAPGVRPHVVVSGRASRGWVTVSVQDNGVGIPHRDRERVLDSFYRSPATAHLPGNGLGLAITASAVERHGGRVHVHDAPHGSGTVVSLTLPAA